MKYLNLTILAAFLLIICSCKKNSDSYVDELTFGTSYYTDFSLIGKGNAFSVSPGYVAFRLESSEDFNGNAVKFVIKKDGFAYSTEIYTDNPTPTGHIFLTSLNFTQKGSYSVTGYIVKAGGDKTVASASFQML